MFARVLVYTIGTSVLPEKRQVPRHRTLMGLFLLAINEKVRRHAKPGKPQSETDLKPWDWATEPSE